MAGALRPLQLNDPGPQIVILHQAAAVRRVLQPVSQLALRRGGACGCRREGRLVGRGWRDGKVCGQRGRRGAKEPRFLCSQSQGRYEDGLEAGVGQPLGWAAQAVENSLNPQNIHGCKSAKARLSLKAPDGSNGGGTA